MEIITRHLLIRNFQRKDAEELYEILSDAEVMKYIEGTFSMERTQEFVDTAGLSDPPLVYAVEEKETKKVIGHVIFHPYEEESYEIGWVLHRNFWNRGFVGELTEALMEWSKREGIRLQVFFLMELSGLSGERM